MEFKFRAIDGKASTNTTPASSIGYFAEQALRAGYSSPDLGSTAEFFRNPRDVREAIQRELEKQQIREEIILGEIARKRLLEAEVRREMLMEREVAMRRPERFSLFSGTSSSSAMLFQQPRLPLLHQSEGRSLEERLALSLEERVGYEARRGIGGFETLPFQRNAEVKIAEVQSHSEVRKEKVVFLAKPERNLSGTKRKAVTPPSAGAIELPSVGLKKKLKEEWSCAICQVSATSERGLTDHLQGRKHKAREAGLRAQRTGQNYGLGLFPKKTGKPIKLAENTDNQNSEEGKLVGESLQVNKREEGLFRKRSITVSVRQNNEFRLKANQDTDESKNENGGSSMKTQKKGGDHKKFKFWCEMCQVGAFSEKVLNNHKKGKKHAARLLGLNPNSGSVLAAQLVEAPRMENDWDVAECGKETSDNVDGAADGNHSEGAPIDYCACLPGRIFGA